MKGLNLSMNHAVSYYFNFLEAWKSLLLDLKWGYQDVY